MTSYFPDVNTWLALAWDGHAYHTAAAAWLDEVPDAYGVMFSRYTQLGLLRLVTNRQVMGDSVVTLEDAFVVYDRFLEDPRIGLSAEPRAIDRLMRLASRRLSTLAATKVIGDLYLMAFAVATQATMVTFDKAIARALRRQEAPVLLLSPESAHR